MKRLIIALVALFISDAAMFAQAMFAQDAVQNEGKHLFLLSGQSNMARFKPKQWFTPGITKALGADNVTVYFEVKGGQPISKWFKEWKNSKGENDSEPGQICDALLEKMNTATSGTKIQSVTFIWMQGEADAKAENGDVYLASLKGVVLSP